MEPETNGDPVEFPVIAATPAEEQSPSDMMGMTSGKLSASQQLAALRESLSRRAPPPTVNGMSPYLDVMTISSSQFPTTIDGGKNQEPHTRLLMEPIAVPSLQHTGVFVKGGARKKKVPLFYPNGKKNNNFRDTVRGKVRVVARPGVVSPDIAVQDALADSIRDLVKDKMYYAPDAARPLSKSRSMPSRVRVSRTRGSRSRDMTRLMRGEHAPTPGFHAALDSTRRAEVSTSSRRRRGGSKRRRKGRPGSVASSVSGMSRRTGGSHSPRSVASGFSSHSGSHSVISSVRRSRTIDEETRRLLKSLSTTNEKITRALTRA